MIVFTILRSILGIAAILVGVWTFVGIPLGTILFVVYLLTKDQAQKTKLLKWIKISFMSILVMVGLFILWAGISFVSTLLGYNLGSSLPTIGH